MVDSAIREDRPAVRKNSAAVVSCTVYSGRDRALALIDGFCADAILSGYQHPIFLRSWIENAPFEPVCLVFESRLGGPVMLPLERNNAGILVYPGKRHANGNFPLGLPGDIAALAANGEDSIMRAVRSADLGADAIVLERQLQTCEGIANPFVFSRSPTSPNPALALSLAGGFDAVLQRHSGKRRKKRFRVQERRLSELGGYKYIPSVDRHAVGQVLAQFFKMKAERFNKAGITDVFAADYVQSFIKTMFEAGQSDEQRSHELKTLSVNGEPIAIIGCTIHRGHLTVEFGAFSEQFSEFGPGDMLFFLAIREAAERGLECFDFGIGDEFYKRTWCEIETWHKDTIIALTAKGALVGAAKNARSTIVRSIKRHAMLWPTVKVLRRHLARTR